MVVLNPYTTNSRFIFYITAVFDCSCWFFFSFFSFSFCVCAQVEHTLNERLLQFVNLDLHDVKVPHILAPVR